MKGFNMKHPLISKAISGFASFALGDLISQVIEKKRQVEAKEINYKRALIFGLTGLSMAPVYHLQYSIIERRLFNGKAPLKQFFFDQIVCVPIQNFIFLAVLNAWRRNSIEKSKEKIKRCYYNTLISGYKFWPLVTVINFRYVPHRYCEHFFNVVGMGYSAYLSYISK